jgi:hypothetical protein
VALLLRLGRVAHRGRSRAAAARLLCGVPTAGVGRARSTGRDRGPGDCQLAHREVVGAGRCELADLTDRIVWVQADLDVTQRRDAVRVASGEIDEAAYVRWMQEELPFVADQRAWERAFAVVAGTPELPFDARTEIVLGSPSSTRLG